MKPSSEPGTLLYKPTSLMSLNNPLKHPVGVNESNSSGGKRSM